MEKEIEFKKLYFRSFRQIEDFYNKMKIGTIVKWENNVGSKVGIYMGGNIQFAVLEIAKDKKLVLIVMGSVGSKTVNDKIFNSIDKFRGKNYSVVIVTGNSYYEKVKNKRFPENVKVFPFIYEIPRVMKITDLMVTRAGASTMSEITALEVPSIFIPSPYVTNNHQYKNAMDLVNNNAALLLEEKDLDGNKLIEMIDTTLNDKEKLEELKKNLSRLGIKDSSTRIYNVLKDLILYDRKYY